MSTQPGNRPVEQAGPDLHDKRHKQRFGWVKRLMNNRNHGGDLHKYPSDAIPRAQRDADVASNDSGADSAAGSAVDSAADSDMVADNISTIPLKSIALAPSTTSPSVLSDKDGSSYMASTAETSIAPLPSPQTTSFAAASAASMVPTPQDRDSESIVTLASSLRRTRRRSLDTNSSTTGIAPASIMERLTVHPAASAYAPSAYATSGYASSIQNSHADESDADERREA